MPSEHVLLGAWAQVSCVEFHDPSNGTSSFSQVPVEEANDR